MLENVVKPSILLCQVDAANWQMTDRQSAGNPDP